MVVRSVVSNHEVTGHARTRGWRLRLRRAVEVPTLGRLVLVRGLVSEQQLAHAIAIQRLSGERLGRVLVRLDYLDESRLEGLLGRQQLLRWLTYFLG